jgi:Uncharacterized conserved protein
MKTGLCRGRGRWMVL